MILKSKQTFPWDNNLSYASYVLTLIKQQMLYRKTAHSLSKVV